MNLARFKTKLNILLFGHIFNWLWWSSNHRRLVRGSVIAKQSELYFKRYLPKNVHDQKIVKNKNDDTVYTMWLQGEENAPELVKACFRRMRNHLKQKIVVLDENTIFDYITLPDFIIEKRKQGLIKNAHFADICRVELLYEHGGYWLDATGFVTEQIPDFIQDSDFFMFLINPGWGFGYSFIQNCFIRAKKGSYLLAAWREMIFNYWKNENHTFDYFMHQLLFKTLVMNDEMGKKYFSQMPHVLQDGTHALWWGYKDKPFDKKVFKEVTSNAFFQKTTYRKSDNPVQGSFADVMMKMK